MFFKENEIPENWSTDYEGRCGNCHSLMGENDRYCVICGTRRGEGEFKPYKNMMECIYGPEPITRKHRCRECGYKWEACLMIDNERYCPKCGGEVDISPKPW